MNKLYKECGKGWDTIIDPLIEKCNQEGVEILQIKEKFGGLRVYTTNGCSEELMDMIIAAEKASYSTCEMCGQPGSRKSDGWIKTACDLCWTKHLERKVGK